MGPWDDRCSTTGWPHCQQVAAEIRSGIVAGEYKPGAPLPSDTQFIERYKVSRPTVRKAIAALRTKGLIEVIPARAATFAPSPHRRSPAGPPHELSRQGGGPVFAYSVVATEPTSVLLSPTRVTDRLSALRSVCRGRLVAERIAQGGVQLLCLSHRQHQRSQGRATRADDVKRQFKETVFPTAQTTPRYGTDLPAFRPITHPPASLS